MLTVALFLSLVPFPVRAELVEAPPFLSEKQDGPSTSSGRTGGRAQTPIDAERAFDRMAATSGQWTAFRAFAAPEAIMFVPKPVEALELLKGRADPPRSVRWQPIASYIACDGKWAVNTGAWQRPGGKVGYFTTVWYKGSRGWRWLVDAGDALPAPRAVPARPTVRIAKCGGPRSNGFGSEANSGYGASQDATLRWRWHVAPDNSRELVVELWNGQTYDVVIDDKVGAS